MRFIRNIFLALGLLLFPIAASGQIEFTPADFGIGLGLFNSEDGSADASGPFSENDSFDVSRAFFSVQWYGIQGLGIIDASGIGIDVGTASGTDGYRYRVWSLNRKSLAGGLYAGTDMKIASGGAGTDKWAGDFDLRIVTGYSFSLGDKYRLKAEIYGLEEDSQVAGALIFTWE